MIKYATMLSRVDGGGGGAPCRSRRWFASLADGRTAFYRRPAKTEDEDMGNYCSSKQKDGGSGSDEWVKPLKPALLMFVCRVVHVWNYIYAATEWKNFRGRWQ